MHYLLDIPVNFILKYSKQMTDIHHSFNYQSIISNTWSPDENCLIRYFFCEVWYVSMCFNTDIVWKQKCIGGGGGRPKAYTHKSDQKVTFTRARALADSAASMTASAEVATRGSRVRAQARTHNFRGDWSTTIRYQCALLLEGLSSRLKYCCYGVKNRNNTPLPPNIFWTKT